MEQTYNSIVTFSTCLCPDCGIPFGMTQQFHTDKRNTGARFYCPAGHSLSYKDNENSRLEAAAKRAQELLESKRRECDDLRGEIKIKDRQVAAAKGRVTKANNRAKAGVCPCCTRTFSNMARHMKDMHPEFAKAE